MVATFIITVIKTCLQSFLATYLNRNTSKCSTSIYQTTGTNIPFEALV